MKLGVRIVKFIQLLAIMSLPSAAIAAPDSVPATDNDDPAVVDDPATAPVTKTLSPMPLKRPPPMTVTPTESFKLTLSDDKKVIHLMGSFRSGISAALKTMLIVARQEVLESLTRGFRALLFNRTAVAG